MLYKILSAIQNMFVRYFVNLSQDKNVTNVMIIKVLLISLNKVDFILSWID